VATQTIQQAMQLVDEKQIPPFGFAWFVLAEIAWERNELASAEQYLTDGIELSKQGVLIDDLRFELISLVRLKKSTGDLAAATSAIKQAHLICQSFQIPHPDSVICANGYRSYCPISSARGVSNSIFQGSTRGAIEHAELRI